MFVLSSTFLALLALHLVVVLLYQLNIASGRLPRLYSRFYFDQEANIPTYFSPILLLMSAVLLAMISGFKKSVGDRWAMHWRVLAILFVLMSLDEAVSLHEMLNKPLQDLVSISGYLTFGWVFIGLIVVAVLGMSYWRFLWSLERPLRIGIMAAGGMYVGGTIVMEMIGARLSSDPGFGTASLSYMMAVTVEESLEMTGIILFIAVLAGHLRSNVRTFTLSE